MPKPSKTETARPRLFARFLIELRGDKARGAKASQARVLRIKMFPLYAFEFRKAVACVVNKRWFGCFFVFGKLIGRIG